jgi:hypothetical protein
VATLDDVATFIASACSLTVGTDLFKGKLPDTPDECAAVFEYGGLAPDYTLGQTAASVEYPRIQFVFRGDPDDYSGPRATAETAYRACAAQRGSTLTSTKYQALLPLQPPFLLNRDPKGRVSIAFNVQAMKELSA